MVFLLGQDLNIEITITLRRIKVYIRMLNIKDKTLYKRSSYIKRVNQELVLESQE